MSKDTVQLITIKGMSNSFEGQGKSSGRKFGMFTEVCGKLKFKNIIRHVESRKKLWTIPCSRKYIKTMEIFYSIQNFINSIT